MIITRTTNKGERRYLVRIYTGLDVGADGRPRRKYLFRQFPRLKEAETWEREQELAKGKGALVIPSKQQLRDFLRAWLDGPKKAEVREATWQDYEETLDRAGLLPDTGKRPHPLGFRSVSDVTPEALKLYYAELATKGMPQESCGPLGTRSLRFVHSLLFAALREAVAQRILHANPAAGLRIPKGTHLPRGTIHSGDESGKIQALSGEQLSRLLSAACLPPAPKEGTRANGRRWRYRPTEDHNRWFALFHLLALGGLRPSEALGLTAKDIDWVDNAVHIRHTLKTGLKGGGWKLEDPKTTDSRRSVSLPADAMALLRRHVDRHTAEVTTMTEQERKAYENHGFLFTGRGGRPVDLKNISARHFKPLLKSTGLPPIRLYDLRHTHATLLLTAGVPVHVVSRRLGHKSAKMTLDVYSHVLPGQQEEAVARLEEFLALSAATG